MAHTRVEFDDLQLPPHLAPLSQRKANQVRCECGTRHFDAVIEEASVKITVKCRDCNKFTQLILKP